MARPVRPLTGTKVSSASTTLLSLPASTMFCVSSTWRGCTSRMWLLICTHRRRCWAAVADVHARHHNHVALQAAELALLEIGPAGFFEKFEIARIVNMAVAVEMGSRGCGMVVGFINRPSEIDLI